MPGEPQITQFALVRHAETVWNREKRIQGQQDSTLTSRGRQQAEEWGQALRRYQLDYLVSSDLGRATATAEMINRTLALPRAVDPRLREQDWGNWSGLKLKDLNIADFTAQESQGWNFRPEGGESRMEVLERSHQALVAVARRWTGARVLVVTHGGVIRCLLYRLCQRKFLPGEPRLIKSYRLHWLSCDGSHLRIQRLNEQLEV
ncbi:MAG: histidine phosphatase family protein [Deltaproteobacteria bacterium]|nr:MAG: histidine phosphatase family protein [Deltaproteobacteria bacterium]